MENKQTCTFITTQRLKYSINKWLHENFAVDSKQCSQCTDIEKDYVPLSLASLHRHPVKSTVKCNFLIMPSVQWHGSILSEKSHCSLLLTPKTFYNLTCALFDQLDIVKYSIIRVGHQSGQEKMAVEKHWESKAAPESGPEPSIKRSKEGPKHARPLLSLTTVWTDFVLV